MLDVNAYQKQIRTLCERVRDKPPKPTLQTAYGLLIGALASLQQCSLLVQRCVDEKQDLENLKWDNGAIGGELLSAVDSGAPLDWGSGTNYRVWALGLFLNKAQANISAAIDRLINARLERRIPTWKSHELAFLLVWPTGRLAVLENIDDPQIGTLCTALREQIEYAGTEEARKELENVAGRQPMDGGDARALARA